MKKKILFLLHLPPPVHGSSLVGEMIRSSNVNNTFDCSFVNLLSSRNISETGKTGLVKSLRFILTWFDVLARILTGKPDLCYFALTTTGAAFIRDASLVLLLKLFRIKLCYHLHNKGVSRFQNSMILSPVYKFVFHDVNVILLSRFLYNDIKAFVPEQNVYVCPNGIPDTGSIKGISKPAEHMVKILFLSNLIESKGVFVLMEACTVLHSKGLPFKLIIIGDRGDISIPDFKSRVSQLGLSESIEFPGPKYGEEKKRALADADIFAFPTYYPKECFPLVLLEAMRSGLPVISTFEGGIADIVENGVTGFLVRQRDVGMLAEKLEILICDPDLRGRMSIAAKEKFDTQFKLSAFEKNISSILSKLVTE